MWVFHWFGYSQVSYKYPVRPRSGEKLRFWDNTLSHVGRDLYALDIIIPDPRKTALPVWAPQSGVVISLQQHNTLWGQDASFAPYMNYVKVAVSSTEFYMIAHIGKNSCPFALGERVKIGQQLASSGVNGWMTDVRHLHFIVGRIYGGDYKSLKIRWSRFQNYAPANS